MSASPSATSSSTSIHRNSALNPEETDLWELCYYAGVTIDPQVFRILVDLLRMDVHPKAVVDVLKTIAPYSKYAEKVDGKKESTSKNTGEKSISLRQTSSLRKSRNQDTSSVSSSTQRNSNSSIRSASLERRNQQTKASRSSSKTQLPTGLSAIGKIQSSSSHRK